MKLGCVRALDSSRRKPQRTVHTEGKREKPWTSGNKPNPQHPPSQPHLSCSCAHPPLPDPRCSWDQGAQDPVWPGHPILMGTCAGEGASVLTRRGLQGTAWAGPRGPATSTTRRPSAAGQGLAASLPRAVEHACPILVPINGRLCTMWARLFSCVGSFRAWGRGRPRKEEGAVLPQEKGAAEPCEDRQGVPPRARP